jgi:protein SCO1
VNPSHVFRRRLLGASGLLGALPFLAACEQAPKASFKSVDITGAEYARRFTLQDPDGRDRMLSDFKGKLAVVFFGYTQCPDVCPTTLSALVETKRLLGADGDKLQPIFVSVDPERDTPDLLRAYVAAFDPSFIGLRGSPEATAATAKEFKVFFRKVEGKTPTSYTVDHTAASYVFDREGRVRLYVRHATPPAELAEDLKTLLKLG